MLIVTDEYDFEYYEPSNHVSPYALRQAAKEWVEEYEKIMEDMKDEEREGYLFMAGKRWALIEFFKLEADK